VDGGYVAECQEFAIVTQGGTLDEVMQNLSEAVSLYLEDEDLGISCKLSLRLFLYL
jgi:predicted RNase H-like HicB family nuclease